MVYTERTDRYIEPKDQCSGNSSKLPDTSAKYSPSSSSNKSDWERSKQLPSGDKWKYNNMVRNDREKFNSLHFC